MSHTAQGENPNTTQSSPVSNGVLVPYKADPATQDSWKSPEFARTFRKRKSLDSLDNPQIHSPGFKSKSNSIFPASFSIKLLHDAERSTEALIQSKEISRTILLNKLEQHIQEIQQRVDLARQALQSFIEQELNLDINHSIDTAYKLSDHIRNTHLQPQESQGSEERGTNSINQSTFSQSMPKPDTKISQNREEEISEKLSQMVSDHAQGIVDQANHFGGSMQRTVEYTKGERKETIGKKLETLARTYEDVKLAETSTILANAYRSPHGHECNLPADVKPTEIGSGQQIKGRTPLLALGGTSHPPAPEGASAFLGSLENVFRESAQALGQGESDTSEFVTKFQTPFEKQFFGNAPEGCKRFVITITENVLTPIVACNSEIANFPLIKDASKSQIDKYNNASTEYQNATRKRYEMLTGKNREFLYMIVDGRKFGNAMLDSYPMDKITQINNYLETNCNHSTMLIPCVKNTLQAKGVPSTAVGAIYIAQDDKGTRIFDTLGCTTQIQQENPKNRVLPKMYDSPDNIVAQKGSEDLIEAATFLMHSLLDGKSQAMNFSQNTFFIPTDLQHLSPDLSSSLPLEKERRLGVQAGLTGLAGSPDSRASSRISNLEPKESQENRRDTSAERSSYQAQSATIQF